MSWCGPVWQEYYWDDVGQMESRDDIAQVQVLLLQQLYIVLQAEGKDTGSTWEN